MIIKNNIPKLYRNKKTVTNPSNTIINSGSVIIGGTVNVIDNLVTNSPSEALSAKQGMILNDIKLSKSSIKDNLSSDSDSDALSARLGKILNLGKLDKSTVTDNLSSTSSSNPLSARLGKNLNDNKLSKTSADTAKELITFDKGLVTKSDVITSDFGVNSGAALFKDADGKWNLELDKAKIRGKLDVQELNLDKARYVGGKLICTLASIKVTKVVRYSQYYRCYFKTTDSGGNTITNNFVSGDMAFSQSFRNNNSRRWWRGVMYIGADYIDVAADNVTNAFESGSDIPVEGDEVIQLGNINNTARQNAIIISSFDNNAPSIIQYKGINTFSLAGKEVSVISPNGNRFTGDFISKTSNENLETVINKKADEINLSIKEIEVGGVNLYQSNTNIGAYRKGGLTATTNKIADKTKNGFKVIGTKENDTYVYLHTNFKESGYYTMSFKVLCNYVAWDFDVMGTFMNNKTKANNDILLGHIHIDKGITSAYSSFVFYVDPDLFDSNVNFWMTPFGGTTYYFTDFKIEKGNKGTAWTPSPFDDNKELLETGINISNKEITVTANKFNVRGTNGAVIADFITDKNGKPVIKAPNLDIDNINAENCHFKYGSMSGILMKEPIEITPNNLSDYIVYNSVLQMNVLDLSRLGSLIVFRGDFGELDVTVNLLGSGNNTKLNMEMFKYIGSQVVIINKSTSFLMVCGATHSFQCHQIYPNYVTLFTCALKKSSNLNDGGFLIGWTQDYIFELNSASPLSV